MPDENELARLIARLHQRTVTHWAHIPGETPKFGGVKSDPDCLLAARYLERLQRALAVAVTHADQREHAKAKTA
jgi:hypothetical protein